MMGKTHLAQAIAYEAIKMDVTVHAQEREKRLI